MFQFQNGAVKRTFAFNITYNKTLFQFQNGAVKRWVYL